MSSLCSQFRRAASRISLPAITVYLIFCGADKRSLVAQEPPSKEQSELVQGLLDLLGESPAKAPQDPVVPEPIGTDLDGEALGDRSSTPLESVRQNMLLAASLLSKGRADTETRQIQSRISQGLDDLISELEKSNASPDSSEHSQQQRQDQQSSSQPGQQSEQSTSSQASEHKEVGEGDSQNGQPAQDVPSPKGTAGEVVLELVDPKLLQQEVWGQLPEQVRKQMQSRMVERFLPSYRAQIEAYFQALLENRKP